MNIGKKNGVGAQHILGLINDKIQKRNISEDQSESAG